MAVTFTSNGYDTTSTNPYTEVAWANAHPSIGTASYGVRNASDWKVTAVAGSDRTVSIAGGFGWGHGVTDQTTDNETIQLDTVASGSRWDLIVARRDWTPTAGVTSFQKVNGGSDKVIPGGRMVGPGDIDDQPIALVQVTAGQTQPTAIVDLRCWTGDGGGLIAADDLARSYMPQPGTRVWVGGIDWVRTFDTNGVAYWDTINKATQLDPLQPSGYSVTGKFTSTQLGQSKLVVCDITIKRTGSDITLAGDSYSGFGAVIPSAVRGTSENKYLPVGISGTSTQLVMIAVNTSTGNLSIKGMSADFTWKTGTILSVNCAWVIA